MKPQSVNHAINAAAELWECDPSDPTGQDRTQRAIGPRHALVWWLHVRLGVSLSDIARRMGSRHHTSVMHAVRTVQEALTADSPNKRQVWLARCAREIDEAFEIRRAKRVRPAAPKVEAEPVKVHPKGYEPGFPKQKPCIAGCGVTVTLKTRNDRRKCARCHHNHGDLGHLEGIAA